MKGISCFSVVVLACCPCAAVSAQTKALPETAKLIPPETVLLVEIPDFNSLQKQFEKTSFYKFYEDPAMAPFVEDFRTKWREKVRAVGDKLGEAIVSVGALPEGRAVLALVLNEQAKDANDPPFLLITQWGGKTAKVKEAIDKMAEEAVNEGLHRKTEHYRDVDIVTIISDGSKQVSYSFIDDSLIASANLDVLKFVIAHLKGAESPALAEDSDFSSCVKATGPHHDLDCYVNIKQIIKTAAADDEHEKKKTAITNLGFDNVASFGFSVGLGRQTGEPLAGKALVKINGSKRGVCKMLDAEAAVLKTPKFIPASACAMMVLNVDIKKAYEELGNIVRSFSPGTGAAMYVPLIPPSPEGEPGLELKRDIIDYMGSQIIIAQSIKKITDGNSPPPETITAIAVNNRQAIEKSLATLHSKVLAPGKPEAKRELLGYSIYVLGPGGFPFFMPGLTPMQAPLGQSGAQPPSLAFTVTGNYLIFGPEAAVERAIRALSSSETTTLDSAEWFTLVKSAMPSNVGLVSLQDNAAASKPAWEAMRKISKDTVSPDGEFSMSVGMSSSLGLLFSQTGSNLFNFSLLPEFDKVRKYFGVSTSYGVSRPDGFYFEFKYLDSPELR
jgi:hypothetical protein